jgi:hypothetical protein
MPKISEAGGPTDENQPDYYDQGKSFQSPNVTDAEVTEEKYTEVMERHGTDSWTEDDERIRARWEEQRKANSPDSEPDQADEQGSPVPVASPESNADELATPDKGLTTPVGEKAQPSKTNKDNDPLFSSKPDTKRS